MFEVFDQPDPNVTCERRNVSTVPTQALTLLNNPFLLGQARLFAQRVIKISSDDDEERITGAYEIALSRPPTDREMTANLRFLAQQRQDHTSRGAVDAGLAALVDLCNVILNLNEFVYLN